jgi:hypothetical protein
LLIAQRNAGPHTGINKEIVATSKPALQSIQEFKVRVSIADRARLQAPRAVLLMG